MIADDSPFDWAEALQSDPDDARFRAKAVAAAVCLAVVLLFGGAAAVVLATGGA
jgi:hypothetical protein